MEIAIKMKSGSMMKVEAEAHCYKDSDGAGRRWDVVEDLTCYWPWRKGQKKAREIPPSLYDVEQAEDAFWEAATDRSY